MSHQRAWWSPGKVLCSIYPHLRMFRDLEPHMPSTVLVLLGRLQEGGKVDRSWRRAMRLVRLRRSNKSWMLWWNISSFISAPMMIFSPSRIHLVRDASKSSMNAKRGDLLSFRSFKYFMCCACKVNSPLPSLAECETGRYALTTRRKEPLRPWKRAEVHRPRPEGSSSVPHAY
jgi:hypothetical protein